MTALMTPDELRNTYMLETDLSDGALQDLIDAETEEIRQRVGTTDGESVVEVFHPGYHEEFLILSQDVGSITSIVTPFKTLDPSEYFLNGTNILTRRRNYWWAEDENLSDQYYAAERQFLGMYWESTITVTYVPAFPAGLRARCRTVLVQLVKLYIGFEIYSALTGPDGGMKSRDYTTERKAILDSLTPDWVIV